MSLQGKNGAATPTRLRGLPEAVQRQFDAFFEWILQLRLHELGLFLPVRLTGASNTIGVGHRSKYLLVSHSSATALALPAAVSAAMPVGAAVYMCQTGTGQLTLAAGSGVTIRTAETLKTRKQWSSMTAVKVDRYEWILNGDLELA